MHTKSTEPLPDDKGTLTCAPLPQATYVPRYYLNSRRLICSNISPSLVFHPHPLANRLNTARGYKSFPRDTIALPLYGRFACLFIPFEWCHITRGRYAYKRIKCVKTHDTVAALGSFWEYGTERDLDGSPTG